MSKDQKLIFGDMCILAETFWQVYCMLAFQNSVAVILGLHKSCDFNDTQIIFSGDNILYLAWGEHGYYQLCSFMVAEKLEPTD